MCRCAWFPWVLTLLDSVPSEISLYLLLACGWVPHGGAGVRSEGGALTALYLVSGPTFLFEDTPCPQPFVVPAASSS